MGIEWCGCKERASRGGAEAAIAGVACDESSTDTGFDKGDD
jgi:hypothetical protein